MKTIELMSTKPRAVRAIERLDAAARALWEEDCGVVPVVDSAGALVGVVTDRDLCMASYTQGRALDEIPVSAAMAREVATCRQEDTATEVMQEMQRLQVHRLPVVDSHGQLVGMVSTNDLVRASHARPAAVDPSAVIRTLATIGSPRRQAIAAPASPPRKAQPAAASAVASKPATRAPAPKKQAARSRPGSTTKKPATRASKKPATRASKPKAKKKS